MAKRTVSVFRFHGYEHQSNFPIGSEEFDKELEHLVRGYLNFPNSDIMFQAEAPFGTPNFDVAAVLQNKPGALGVVPVSVLWIEKMDLSEKEDTDIIYPKVFHTKSSFIGRIEVEAKPIELAVV